MWEESLQIQQDEEMSGDTERTESSHYDHDDNVETTYERATREYTEEDARRDEIQANYETDAKMGAI